MGDRYCTQCGKRLTGAARFCPSCGSPLDAGDAAPSGVKGAHFFEPLRLELRVPGSTQAGEKSSRGSLLDDAIASLSRAKGPNLFEPLRLESRAPGSTQAGEEKCVAVLSRDLDRLVAYSFMNTPLDSQFLLVQSEQHQRAIWVPVKFIESMQGLKAIGSAWVYYRFGDNYPSAPEGARSWVISEVKDAFRRLDNLSRVRIACYPNFKRVNYGEFEVMRGKWVTKINDTTNHYTVATVAPLPMSGWMMRRRLLEHESWINRVLPSLGDDWRQYLTEKLRELRAALKEIPDGLADCVECIAFTWDVNNWVHTVLADEDQAPGKAPIRAAGLMEVSEPATARGALRMDSARMTLPSLAGVPVPGNASVVGSTES